jgi:hypothetical protein
MREMREFFTRDPNSRVRYKGLTEEESDWLERAFSANLEFDEAHRIVALLCRRLSNCRKGKANDTD